MRLQKWMLWGLYIWMGLLTYTAMPMAMSDSDSEIEQLKMRMDELSARSVGETPTGSSEYPDGIQSAAEELYLLGRCLEERIGYEGMSQVMHHAGIDKTSPAAVRHLAVQLTCTTHTP